MPPIAEQKRRLDTLLASGRITLQQHGQMLALLTNISKRRGPATSRLESVTQTMRVDKYLRAAIYALIAGIFLLFTPYTHQLDEIKQMLLYAITPVILLAALPRTLFSERSRKMPAPILLLGLFAVANIVSVLLNIDTWQRGERLLWFNMALFSITFMLALLIDSPSKVRNAVRFLCVAGIVLPLVGFAMRAGYTQTLYEFMRDSETLRHSPWATLMYTLSASRGHLFSTVLNSEFYAELVVILLPITLAGFVAENRRGWKTVAMVSFVLLALCLPYTRELFAIVVASIAIAVTALLLYRTGANPSGTMNLALFASAAAILLALMPAIYTQPESGFWQGTKASRRIMATAAVEIWQHGSAMAPGLNWKSVLFGTGLGGFGSYFPIYRPGNFFDYGINSVTGYSHNYFADLLCELGIVGLLLFVVFAGVVVWSASRQVARGTDETSRVYQVGFLVSVVAALCISYISPSNRWSAVAVCMWSVIGISIAVSRVFAEQVAVAERSAAGFNMQWSRPFLQFATASIAVVFFVRSTPQGLQYYRAAIHNATGLKYMESGLLETQTAETTKMLTEAERYFHLAIDYNPTFATSYYKLGNVQNSLGKTDEAIQTYEQLNKLWPNYSEVHLNLLIMNYVKYSEEKDPTRKLDCLKQAVDEGRIAARQSLAPNVQMLVGDTIRELADYQQVLGNSSERMKLLAEAKPHYQNVVDYHPLTEGVRKARKEKLPTALARLRDLDLLLSPTRSSTTAATATLKEPS